MDVGIHSSPRRRARLQGRRPELRWRLVRDGAQPGARNMAVDHALAACARGGEGALRLYRWARPTLSLGRNEPAGAYPLGLLREGGTDVVRRPTGGRAVLHDAELTYAVVAPLSRSEDAGWGARAAYRAIHEGLAAALQALGAPVELTGEGARVLPPDAGPCFGAPAPGEVVASGRKLVGSAQARIGTSLLQHGSILLAGSQPGPGAITLSELLPDVSIDEVTAAVAQSLRGRLGGEWREGGLLDHELEAADRLERERYSDETWTLRR